MTPQAAAFDVAAVCAGFVYALSTANAFIRSGQAHRVLVIGAETFSRILDWNDRRTCVLFGDGAGAAVLVADDETGILGCHIHTDGRFGSILNVPASMQHGQIVGSPYLYMDGQAVFKFAVKALSELAARTLEQAGFAQSELDWLVPHQANLRIIEATASFTFADGKSGGYSATASQHLCCLDSSGFRCRSARWPDSTWPVSDVRRHWRWVCVGLGAAALLIVRLIQRKKDGICVSVSGSGFTKPENDGWF